VVDSAIYEAVLAMMESLVTEWQVAGYQRERTGAILPNIAPSNVYPTVDGGSVLIAANQDSVFRRLTAVMGEPELADDPRYATHGARGANMTELDERIGRWSARFDADTLLSTLDAAGVPAGRIYRPRDMLADPHMIERESLVTVPDPTFGELAMQNVAPRLSRTPGSIRWTGPALGEHTHEVLHDLLGYSDAEITDLAGASGA
jgi:formyl-CoA transferase